MVILTAISMILFCFAFVLVLCDTVTVPSPGRRTMNPIRFAADFAAISTLFTAGYVCLLAL
ncbi:MAG: hypothetical protein OQK23_09035 [Rhodospirillales bacterium]|nr:hypothetical protein [Rhodospirillales bacterium]